MTDDEFYFWNDLTEKLCSFAYAVGTEAARDGADFIEAERFEDPRCRLAWETGYCDFYDGPELDGSSCLVEFLP